MRIDLLPASGNDYKANLHTHSTFSDGKFTVEELKELYKKEGYAIVAFTDHDILIPHPELADENFLPLNSFEVEITQTASEQPVGPRRKTCHLCMIALEPDNVTQPCWHRSAYQFGNAKGYRDRVQFDESLPDFVRTYSGECVNEFIRISREKGFFVTYNHPTWSQESYPEYIRYRGMNAMEMTNSSCLAMGYDEHNERVYDDLLRAGQRIFCLCTDDTHSAKDLFGGWTMIRAPRLAYREVTSALERGEFYCSEGPVIRDLYVEDGKVTVTTEGAREIRVMRGLRRAGIARASDAPLTEATFQLYAEDGYFRITVEDFAGRRAYTNAYFTDTLGL